MRFRVDFEAFLPLYAVLFCYERDCIYPTYCLLFKVVLIKNDSVIAPTQLLIIWAIGVMHILNKLAKHNIP